jgi:hypothetical protein
VRAGARDRAPGWRDPRLAALVVTAASVSTTISSRAVSDLRRSVIAAVTVAVAVGVTAHPDPLSTSPRPTPPKSCDSEARPSKLKKRSKGSDASRPACSFHNGGEVEKAGVASGHEARAPTQGGDETFRPSSVRATEFPPRGWVRYRVRASSPAIVAGPHSAAQERLGSKIVVILVQFNLSLTTWWRSRQGFRSAARRRTGRVTATER